MDPQESPGRYDSPGSNGIPEGEDEIHRHERGVPDLHEQLTLRDPVGEIQDIDPVKVS